MLAAILRRHAGEAGALATRGNLNTDIGVPLTLLGLRAGHRYCAIELGMNHPGEIASLAAIACPTVALVNNAQREHLEFMHTVEAVAAENASVFEALPAAGVAVLNADDAMADVFRGKAGNRRRIEFGLRSRRRPSRIFVAAAGERDRAADAGGRGEGDAGDSRRAQRAQCACRRGLRACGRGSAGGDRRRSRRVPALRGRLQVKKTAAGATLIDDSYNANPDSVRAAIDVLASCPGPTALVLGDMGEVGEQGPEFHAEVGRYARERGYRFCWRLVPPRPRRWWRSAKAAGIST